MQWAMKRMVIRGTAMLEQQVLDCLVAEAVAVAFPSFAGKAATPSSLRDLEDEIYSSVAGATDQPFKVCLHHENGAVTVQAWPLETEQERVARETAIQDVIKAAEERERAEHNRWIESRPARASTVKLDGSHYISIEEMKKELQHWRAPPHVYNEAAFGFEAALQNVLSYLDARAGNKRRTAEGNA